MILYMLYYIIIINVCVCVCVLWALWVSKFFMQSMIIFLKYVIKMYDSTSFCALQGYKKPHAYIASQGVYLIMFLKVVVKVIYGIIFSMMLILVKISPRLLIILWTCLLCLLHQLWCFLAAEWFHKSCQMENDDCIWNERYYLLFLFRMYESNNSRFLANDLGAR